jgi:chromosome segregation ATPase
MAAKEMLSELQAREENMKMADYMRKQRIFYRTKEMLIHQKYQDKIKLMKKQMSNNSYMNDKMNQLETTNQVFKQNLMFTQQSLASAEKVIEKLNEEIKKIEADRQRLSKYKVSKAERLKELEDKIKNYEVYENVDTEKLVQVLVKQDNEVKDLRSVAKNCENRIYHTENKAKNEMSILRSKFQSEQTKQHQVVEKMEQMKMELKMLETSDSSVASIWKKKCVELFEVCNVLKEENTEVRTLCNELIL